MILVSRSFPRKSRRGVAAVELAVLLPFLLLIMVWALDFGLVFYGTVTAGNAATNAAYWEVYQNNGDSYPYPTPTAAAMADTTNLPASNFNVTAADSMDYAVSGDPYNTTLVNVQYTFTTITGVVGTTNINRKIVVRHAGRTPN